MLRRIEPMAVGWGGLIASIGLLVGADRSTVTRLLIIAVTFALGGFLAGIRAEELRAVHGIFTAIAAYLFYSLFVVVGHVVDVAGGPDAPEFMPGPNRDWWIAAAVGTGAAFVGAGVAAARLRPQGEQRRRRTT
jgi:hypothetical protein